MKSTLTTVQKQDLSSSELSSSFPFPLVEDVDSDAWIDLTSIDELEAKMSEMIGISTPKSNNKQDTATVETMGRDGELKELDHVMTGLESFVQNKSDIEGVSTNAPTTFTYQQFDPKKVSPKVFLSLFHDVLKAESSPGDIPNTTSDFVLSAQTSNDKELLKYFSQEDLNFDDDIDEDVDYIGENNEHGVNTMSSLSDVMVRYSFVSALFLLFK